MDQPNIKSKISKQKATVFSWFQPTYSFPVSWDAQCHDRKHILETRPVMGIALVLQLNYILQLLYFAV